MSDVNLKLVISISRSYNAIFSKIEKNVQTFGLNVSEFGVLEMLYHKGEQPVQKIAEKILVTSGTVTYVIDKLEKKELVYRKKSDHDKRIFYVYLSPKGEELIASVFPKHKEFLSDLFKDIDEESKLNIVNDIFNLYDSIKNY